MEGIPKTEMTLAELLQKNGYATACIGKWHVGLEQGNRPLDRGFDRFYGFLGPSHDYFDPAVGVVSPWPAGQRSEVFDQEQPVTQMNYITDELTDRSIVFIRDSVKAGKPFFLYLPFTRHTVPRNRGPTLPKNLGECRPGTRRKERHPCRRGQHRHQRWPAVA